MVARLAALALLLSAGLAAGVALGASSSSPGLRQIEADRHSRERDRDIARAEADAARSEIAQLQAQLVELAASERTGERAVSEKRLQLAALTVRETELDSRLGGNQGQLTRLLGALELFRADPPPALFVDSHNVRDAVRAAILIRAITPELAQRARALRAEALDLKQVRRRVATTSEVLFTTESDVADRRAQIESLIAAKTAIEHQATAEAVAAGLDAEALSARGVGLRGSIPGEAMAGTPGEPAPPDPEQAGAFGHAKPFVAPVQGSPTRRFGAAASGSGPRSSGWTWRPTAGAVVQAPATGVVEYAEPLKGWGVVLILRLGGGYRLVLAGLDAPLVATGQKVEAGQTIGRMPADTASGADLYFEIRKNGALVDPARWLKSPARQTARR